MELYIFKSFQFVYPLVCMYTCMLSHFSCVWICATLWAATHQAPLSMRFSRQEYRSGLPFPSPEDLRDPGIKPESPTLQGTLHQLGQQQVDSYPLAVRTINIGPVTFWVFLGPMTPPIETLRWILQGLPGPLDHSTCPCQSSRPRTGLFSHLPSLCTRYPASSWGQSLSAFSPVITCTWDPSPRSEWLPLRPSGPRSMVTASESPALTTQGRLGILHPRSDPTRAMLGADGTAWVTEPITVVG